jgi:DHA1 family multidrug resistance protein-like MFS transporter
MATSQQQPYGTGIIRTESGHQTYLPDGIISSEDGPRDSDLSHSSTLPANEKGEEQHKDDGSDSAAAAAASGGQDRDVEKGGEEQEEQEDPNLVDWDGPDDKANPMNWSPRWKWTIAVNFGLMTFVVSNISFAWHGEETFLLCYMLSFGFEP